MRVFYEAQTTGFRVVDKSMYIEIEADDFEHGVGHLVSTAISSFQFDQRFNDIHCIGVRVLRSMKLEFFDIKERLATLTTSRLTSPVSSPEPVPSQNKSPIVLPQSWNPGPKAAEMKFSKIDVHEAPSRLSGHLQGIEEVTPSAKELLGFINGFYRTKGEGFISGQDGNSYYFKLDGVADGKLRDRLINLPYYETAVPVEGTISFRSVGKTRPNAKYEEARGLKSA